MEINLKDKKIYLPGDLKIEHTQLRDLLSVIPTPFTLDRMDCFDDLVKRNESMRVDGTAHFYRKEASGLPYCFGESPAKGDYSEYKSCEHFRLPGSKNFELTYGNKEHKKISRTDQDFTDLDRIDPPFDSEPESRDLVLRVPVYRRTTAISERDGYYLMEVDLRNKVIYFPKGMNLPAEETKKLLSVISGPFTTEQFGRFGNEPLNTSQIIYYREKNSGEVEHFYDSQTAYRQKNSGEVEYFYDFQANPKKIEYKNLLPNAQNFIFMYTEPRKYMGQPPAITPLTQGSMESS